MKLSWHRLIITTPNPKNSKYETGADKKFWTAGSQKAQMFVLNSALWHHPHVSSHISVNLHPTLSHSCFGAQAVQNARPQWRDHVNPVAPSVTSRHGRPAAAAKSTMFNPPQKYTAQRDPKRVLAGKSARIFESLPPFRFVSQVIQDDWKMLWILGWDVRCDPFGWTTLTNLTFTDNWNPTTLNKLNSYKFSQK